MLLRLVINMLGIKSKVILKWILAMGQQLLLTIVCIQVAIFLNTAKSRPIYQDIRLISSRTNKVNSFEQMKNYDETNKLKNVLRYLFHENIQNGFTWNGLGINIKVRGHKLQQLLENGTERKEIIKENASDLNLSENLERKWFNRFY